jgi:cytochrome c-type biogenesis protein CcmF
MEYIGEHLWLGKLGHFFILVAFIASLLSTISYFFALNNKQPQQQASWLKMGRLLFFAQGAALLAVFAIIFTICANHYFEYMYAYKHASKELEPKYLLACIWEGQEGSFLLWCVWHTLLGGIVIFKNKNWEALVLAVINTMQFFMLFMLLGIYVGEYCIGSSLFTLTRNEIAAPIFSNPNYINLIKDGVGLNVLLRNYWMVIHPPVLFLGFALTTIPFGFALGALLKKDYAGWVKPALPWTVAAACILGVGIMMGGKWAYESLSFGGYWAWDPVENASLVPWLILIAGLHTMVIYNATKHSLKASYILIFLTLAFVLYSTFLTKTGILGEASVHSFTDPGSATKSMITIWVLLFFIVPLVYFFLKQKQIVQNVAEERLNSREFWMFMGSITYFLTGIFIIAKTSIPLYNKLLGTNLATPEDVEFSYNKVMVMVAIIVGLLTAVTQYLKYKNSEGKTVLKKLLWPTLISVALSVIIFIFYPLTFTKHGSGFLVAIYAAAVASIFAVVANAWFIFSALHGKLKVAGGSLAHTGFALMVVGMLISSANKQTISSARVNGIILPAGVDPQTKKTDNPSENLTLVREVPATLANYSVTFLGDSVGMEKNRKFFNLSFTDKQKKEPAFMLKPDVYLMKDNNMSSNPDIKNYLTKDIFTYISYTLDKTEVKDTAQFAVKEMAIGDTSFYSNGYVILREIIKDARSLKKDATPNEIVIGAKTQIVTKDSNEYTSTPLISLNNNEAFNIDDTLFAQNLIIKFAGIGQNNTFKIGVKETNQPIDFVTIKTFVFPYINLVWLGLVVMGLGFICSFIYRAKLNKTQAWLIGILSTLAIFYMFLIAN